MSKNSTDLSDRCFATHNCNDDSLDIGLLAGAQPRIRLERTEVLSLYNWIREEYDDYFDKE